MVARPDGSVDEFTDVTEAERVRVASPGAQLRTSTRHRDVPAVYVVVSDEGELIAGPDGATQFTSAAEAGRLSGHTPGSHVEIRPVE